MCIVSIATNIVAKKQFNDMPPMCWLIECVNEYVFRSLHDAFADRFSVVSGLFLAVKQFDSFSSTFFAKRYHSAN